MHALSLNKANNINITIAIEFLSRLDADIAGQSFVRKNILLDELLIGKLLNFSTLAYPNLAKSWFRFAAWAYLGEENYLLDLHHLSRTCSLLTKHLILIEQLLALHPQYDLRRYFLLEQSCRAYFTYLQFSNTSTCENEKQIIMMTMHPRFWLHY
ncbi:unnamed protein product, partial [Rotaria magnacalcarata]